jgi:hypothetical protein
MDAGKVSVQDDHVIACDREMFEGSDAIEHNIDGHPLPA